VKVSELIEVLKEYDKSLEVHVSINSCGGAEGSYDFDHDVNDYVKPEAVELQVDLSCEWHRKYNTTGPGHGLIKCEELKSPGGTTAYTVSIGDYTGYGKSYWESFQNLIEKMRPGVPRDK
jgi:hypothetical protein